MKFGLEELLVVGLLLGVLGGSWELGFKRLAEKREAISAEIESKSRMLDIIDQCASDASRLSTKLGELDAQITRFDRRIPRDKNEYLLQKDLERIAGSSGITLTNLRYSSPRAGAKCFEQDIEVQFSGGYASLRRFLENLESLDRITRTSALGIARSELDSAISSGRVTLTIYFDPSSRVASIQ